MKQSIVDEEIDEKEVAELKKIYKHYTEKRKEIMENTQFKVEDVFGDFTSNNNFSQEQIAKLNKFLAKIL